MFLVYSSHLQSQGYVGVLIAGHAHGGKVDVGIIYVSWWVSAGDPTNALGGF